MDGLWTIETHAHSAEVSLCAKLYGAETARGVKAAGCDALIMTDHYTPEFFPQGLEGAAYEARVDDFFAGYRAAKAEGEAIGLAVFPALEVRIAAGPEDYLVYGVTIEELKRLGNLAHLTLPQLREKVHSTQEGLLIQAHPFRGYLKCQDAALLDGVEVFNGNPRHDSHNDKALAFARQHKLLMTAGSDVHESMDPGGALMVCPPFADLRGFARLLRQGLVSCRQE